MQRMFELEFHKSDDINTFKTDPDAIGLTELRRLVFICKCSVSFCANFKEFSSFNDTRHTYLQARKVSSHVH